MGCETRGRRRKGKVEAHERRNRKSRLAHCLCATDHFLHPRTNLKLESLLRCTVEGKNSDGSLQR